jgi:hypothetical protein
MLPFTVYVNYPERLPERYEVTPNTSLSTLERKA